MKRLNLLEIAKDPEVEMIMNIFGFENFCGACIHFTEAYKDKPEDSECPHHGKVHALTDWKYDVHCERFFD